MLPSYERPPVTEVVMVAYFAPISGLHVGHLGAYWERVRARFPLLEQQPVLPGQEPELFGPASRVTGFRVELVSMPALPRTWFVSEDKTLVVQIQHDRLVLNWRKVDEHQDYPRYPFLRNTFESELTEFLDFMSAQALERPTRFTGEVGYVNTIRSGAAWASHGEANLVFNTWHPVTLAGLTPEDLLFRQRYVFPNREGEVTGRLYVQADPVFTSPAGEPGFNLSLTARGGTSPDMVDLLDFCDAARERIVTCFDAMTSEAMHREWGQVVD